MIDNVLLDLIQYSKSRIHGRHVLRIMTKRLTEKISGLIDTTEYLNLWYRIYRIQTEIQTIQHHMEQLFSIDENTPVSARQLFNTSSNERPFTDQEYNLKTDNTIGSSFALDTKDAFISSSLDSIYDKLSSLVKKQENLLHRMNY